MRATLEQGPAGRVETDHCTRCHGVWLDSGELATLTAIGNRAFVSCASLAAVDLPANVTSIGGYAFYGCASLTKPWGDESDAGEPTVGGYHLVWSRDLYHVATAFLALGDKGAADRALRFLFEVQQKPDGSFPQNSWLDGRPYWTSLQLDEVAYPLILAHELGRVDSRSWEKHVKPAASRSDSAELYLLATGFRHASR